MKFLYTLPLLLIMVVSCGRADKKSELETLRAQYNALGEQIRLLEEQIAQEDTGSKKDLRRVTVQQFSAAPLERVVTVQGIVDGDQIITLNPTASGEVKSLNAKVGQSVRKGDILARIDAGVLEKTMRELHNALDLATTLYRKQSALWADSIGSEVQYIQAKNQKEGLEAKIASLEEQMELYVLRAPIDGTLEVVNLRLGQIASPQMPAFTIANFGELKVTAEISEAYSAIVTQGEKIDVTFPDINKTIPLNITAVSNFINPKNRTFTIEARLPHISEVKANMLAKVGVVTYRNKEAIAVPINLLQNTTKGNFLWVIDQATGKAAKRDVAAGVQAENMVEITQGLSSEDKVIISGYQGIDSGEEVEIVK